MRFENIVRPFQSIDVSYPRPIVKADSVPPANVVLKVGENGGLKTLGYSYSYALTTYMVKKQKEVSSKQSGSEFTGTWADSIGQPFGVSSN
jgi:hypothetical protein